MLITNKVTNKKKDFVPWNTDTRSTHLAQTQFYPNWQIYLCI